MKKYLHFSESDFVQDDDFIRWVKQGNRTDEDVWQRWISENPEKKEIIENARVIVTQLRFKQEDSLEEKKSLIWSSIESQINEDSLEEKKIVKSKAPLWRVVTIVAAAALIGFIFWPSAVELVHVESGNEMVDVLLPDGSMVFLNKHSSLEYNEKKWEENRFVNLHGEGFFDVEHGSSFTVTTELGNVNVLGTKFNVLLRSEILEVVCESGKVSVITDETKTILNPMEAVRVAGENHRKRSVLPSQSRAKWRTGGYFYNESLLDLVLVDLEQVFNIQIECSKNLGSMQFTGSFNGNDLDAAMKEVCWPLNLVYDINKDNVTIEKK